MLAGTDLGERITHIYGKDLLNNFGDYVDNRTNTKEEVMQMFNAVYHVLSMLEYERLSKGAMQGDNPKTLRLDDDLMKLKMGFSQYRPETRFNDIGIEPVVLSADWHESKKVDFPLNYIDLIRMETVGEVAHALFKKGEFIYAQPSFQFERA